LLARAREPGVWDIVIIGGGATGLGAAVDAAARGFRTLLLEAADFAKGTSSRSTKLVHGGVRYLAKGEIGLVYGALRERGIMKRIAPHLVDRLPFVVPAYTWLDQPYYGAGLTLYSVLAGPLGLGFSRIVGREEALRLAPTLTPDGLKGGVVYYDGQFDDSRMTVALLRTFLDLGGVALNYARAVGLEKARGKIAGVSVRDAETGQEWCAPAKVVVNATGVYADTLRRMDDPQAHAMLAPSQGVHIVLDQSFLPGDHGVMVPKTDDGRVLFAVPWHGRVVIGTTDTPVPEADIEPRALPDEIAFLLSHTRRYLSREPRRDEVLSVFAGLRPLVKATGAASTAALSRDHTIVVSDAGLLTITGGKWTTYRHMAEDTVNRAAQIAGLPERHSPTATLKLRGAHAPRMTDDIGGYGADAPELLQLIASRPAWRAPLHPNLPYRAGEAVWAARYELARTVEDVLARRTRALLLDARASIAAAPAVAAALAEELGHDASWASDQVRQYTELAQGYVLR
jgi:glycerol-3-phosphate dehydrogenase